ncbi:unnamed protein product [Hanseniaspora opuntiae]
MIRLTPAFATTTASNLTSKNNTLNGSISGKSSHYQVLQDIYGSQNTPLNPYAFYNIAENQYTNQNVVFNNNGVQQQDKNVELYNFYDNTGYQYGLSSQANPSEVSNYNNFNNSTDNANKSGEQKAFKKSQPHPKNQHTFKNGKIQNQLNSHIHHNHNPYLTNSSNNSLNSLNGLKNNNAGFNGKNHNILTNSKTPTRLETYSNFKKLSKKCFESLKNNNSTVRHVTAMDINNMIQFIEMYTVLKSYKEPNPMKQQDIVYLLRIILELHRNVRFNLLKLKRKPDYDDQSIYKNLINLLFQLLEMVNNDLIDGKVFRNIKIDQSIIGTLINCYKDFEMIENALKIWKMGIFENSTKEGTYEFKANLFENSEIEKQRVYLNPGVIGSILPILQEIGKVPLDKITRIYQESKSLATMNINQKGMDTLNLGMIQVYLDNDRVEDALQLYEENLKICSKDSNSNNFWKISISEIQFISKCKNIEIAMNFFEKLISQKKTGRKVENGQKNNLQASHVNLFMLNIWNVEKNLEKVSYVWNRVVSYYGSDVYPGVISSLNDTFFKIFFENYSSTTNNELRLQGFMKLIELINENAANIKNNKIENNEVFFNILLTHSSKTWKDFNVYKYLIKCYQTYCNFQLITIVPYRISLKSLGYINNTPIKVIKNTWLQLVNKLKKNGKIQMISNPDFAALRDATLGWCKNEYLPEVAKLTNRIELLKIDLESEIIPNPDCRSNTLLQLDMEEAYNPTMEALQFSGAFDVEQKYSNINNDENFNLQENFSSATLSNLVNKNFISEGSFISSGETSDFDCQTPIYMNNNSSDYEFSPRNMYLDGDFERNSDGSINPIVVDIKNLEAKINILTEEKNSRIELYWQLYNEYKQYCRDSKQQYDYLVQNVLKNFNCLEPSLSEYYNKNLC